MNISNKYEDYLTRSSIFNDVAEQHVLELGNLVVDNDTSLIDWRMTVREVL